MKLYSTSEVAKIIGIHPNTVRLYEEWGLIPVPERKSNGYRVFTEFHIDQFRLARLSFQIELLQNGLRKKIIHMIKTSAKGKFDEAIKIANEYLEQLNVERKNSEEAITIVHDLLQGHKHTKPMELKRHEVSKLLDISMDTLRNWEMNGLLTVKRSVNRYRIYTEDDINRLKIIRSLRSANYSLESILGMLHQLSINPKADIKRALNTPSADSDIISVYDKLLHSINGAKENIILILQLLEEMKTKYL